MKFDFIIKSAHNIKNNSYSPYSNFKVGSALIANSGKIYLGTNIENASYGATICAERVAIFNAIANGERLIKEIAIISDREDIIYPCGICRQVISEFSDENTIIICCRSDLSYKLYCIDDLMPNRFL